MTGHQKKNTIKKHHKKIIFLAFFLGYGGIMSWLGWFLGENEQTQKKEVQCVCQAPSGALHLNQTGFHSAPPQEGFDRVVFWMLATTCRSVDVEKAKIFLDYVRIYEISENQKKLVYEKNYKLETEIHANSGGLYKKNPIWFYEGTSTKISNVVNNKKTEFYIDLAKTPDNLVHWWTDRIKYDPSKKYEFEIRIKIEGCGSLQTGLDFWKGAFTPYNGWDPKCRNTNNCEKCASDWFGETGGEYKILKFDLNCNALQ